MKFHRYTRQYKPAFASCILNTESGRPVDPSDSWCEDYRYDLYEALMWARDIYPEPLLRTFLGLYDV